MHIRGESFLYACVILSLIFRGEQRLRVFEKRVLRIFEPKWDEVTRERAKMHNEELHDLYSWPILFR